MSKHKQDNYRYVVANRGQFWNKTYFWSLPGKQMFYRHRRDIIRAYDEMFGEGHWKILRIAGDVKIIKIKLPKLNP